MTRKQLKRMADETMDYQGRFTVRDLIENMIAEREWQQRRHSHASNEQMTDDPKPTITPEEMQRRRVHVRAAIADNRIEGIATSAATQAVLDAYIRGDIE